MGKSAATSEDSGEAAEKSAKTEAPKEEATPAPKAEKPAPKPEEKPAPKPEEKPEEKPAPKPEEKPAPKPEEKPAPKPEEKPEKKPEEKKAEKKAAPAGPIVGDYIIKGYEGNKNDWHYVKISPVEGKEGVYKWSNRAGVKWTLTKKSDTKFAVGKDCPYFNSGHKEATLKLNDDGKAVSISGPWNEVYIKQQPKAAPKPAALDLKDIANARIALEDK